MANDSIPTRPTLGQHRNRKCGCRLVRERAGNISDPGRMVRACTVDGTPEHAQREALELSERAEVRIRLEQRREGGDPLAVAQRFEHSMRAIANLAGGEA